MSICKLGSEFKAERLSWRLTALCFIVLTKHIYSMVCCYLKSQNKNKQFFYQNFLYNLPGFEKPCLRNESYEKKTKKYTTKTFSFFDLLLISKTGIFSEDYSVFFFFSLWIFSPLNVPWSFLRNNCPIKTFRTRYHSWISFLFFFLSFVPFFICFQHLN